jgi:hypothetical protein
MRRPLKLDVFSSTFFPVFLPGEPMRTLPFCVTAVLLLILLMSQAAPSQTVQFFGAGSSPVLKLAQVDPRIPTPDSILGFPLGSRPARQEQVLSYLRALEAASGRIRVFPTGTTYEGRPLVVAAVGDESTISRLEAIKADLAAIADPATPRSGDIPALISRTPACIWLEYSIHGDEISGVDASLAVLYHLIAATDALTDSIRKHMVVMIDPMENPDGRERYLAQLQSFSSAVPHADGQSMQKGGLWPWGRGNHYLFDMNRDWFALELPETRARMKALTAWHPQVVVDIHEMGQWDTYLFSPARAPFNPYLSERLQRWARMFAGDQAQAFDRNGWAYYSGEWNEEWYPGYASSWPHYTGAVGILYEQAGITGRVARHDGTTMTYAETVTHHYVSSMTNITTTLRNREQLLDGYRRHRVEAVERFGGGETRAYIVSAARHPDRVNALADVLTRQGIHVGIASGKFTASVRGYYDAAESSRAFAPGTLIIPTNQAQGFLIQTILSFDQRLPDSFLTIERRELLKNRDSQLYEVTCWSLLEAYGLDAYASRRSIGADAVPWTPPAPRGGLDGPDAPLGYLFDAGSDAGLRAAVMLLDSGLKLQATRKPVTVSGTVYPPGSVFIAARTNAAGYRQVADSIARLTGISMTGIHSGHADAGPDFGGRELELLRRPRAALVIGGTTSVTGVGWVWHLLDQKLGVPVSLLDIAQVGALDLSVYNVIILPDGNSFGASLGRSAAERLRRWTEEGGTLIAMGGGAGYCADTINGLSAVRLRTQVLNRLPEYDQAALDEISWESPDISTLQIWEYAAPDSLPPRKELRVLPPEEAKKEDDLSRLFSPHGAILKVVLDREHWLSFGMDSDVPVMVTGPTTLLAKYPAVRTVGRFADAPSLRVAGLLWPEARMRFAGTSFCTQEPVGRGQIILFAAQPNFRAFFRGAERILSNAIVFGPGMGTQHTPEW